MVIHFPFNADSYLLDVQNGLFLSTSGAVLADTLVKYGDRSLSCLVTNSYAKITHGGVLDFGTAEFCIEGYFWGHSRSSAYPALWSNYNSYNANSLALFAGHNSGDVSKYQVAAGNGTFPLIQSTSSIAYQVWRHIALCRSANTLSLYIDGVLNGSSSVAGMSFTHSAPDFSIGTSLDSMGASWFNGLVDDFRITIGSPVYTAPFTPPGPINYTAPQKKLAHIAPAIVASAFTTPALKTSKAEAFSGCKDMHYGGNGKIVGTTKNTPSTAVSRRVRLHETKSGHIVQEGWSDSAGNYAFVCLNRGYTYYVVGFDHTDQYQGVVADKLVPEVM